MKVVCLLFAIHFASSFVNSVEIKEFKSDGKLNQGLDIQLVFVVTLQIRDSLASHHENSKIDQRGLGSNYIMAGTPTANLSQARPNILTQNFLTGCFL